MTNQVTNTKVDEKEQGKWAKVMPSFTLPVENPEYTPLYFYQVGSIVFIRTNGLSYAIEINKLKKEQLCKMNQ